MTEPADWVCRLLSWYSDSLGVGMRQFMCGIFLHGCPLYGHIGGVLEMGRGRRSRKACGRNDLGRVGPMRGPDLA